MPAPQDPNSNYSERDPKSDPAVLNAFRKDGDTASPPSSGGLFAAARKRIDGLVSGSAPSDPLYLSNRTFLQKFGVWLVVAIPCLAVGAIFLLLRPGAPSENAPAEISKKELAARVVRDLKPVALPNNADVELSTVSVDRNRSVVTGMIRNRTSHMLQSVEVTFILTDKTGSQKGVIALKLTGLPVNESRPFAVPFTDKQVAYAMVREIQTK